MIRERDIILSDVPNLHTLMLSSDDEARIEGFRRALKLRSKGDDSEMWRFEERGISIEFEQISPHYPDLEFPSRASVRLSGDAQIQLTFPAVMFSPRNLISSLMVPEQELRSHWRSNKSLLVIATSPKLEDPRECLYTHLIHDSHVGGFRVHRLFDGLREVDEALKDTGMTKFLAIFTGETHDEQSSSVEPQYLIS